MFKVTLTEWESAGGKFFSARGVGMHRSPQVARRLAYDALVTAWVESGQDGTPIMGESRVERDGKLLSCKFD